jgi:hypothetical protein
MTRTAFPQPSAATVATHAAEGRRLHDEAVREAFATLARRIAAAFASQTPKLSQA